MSDYYYPRDPFSFVEHNMPEAIRFAEREQRKLEEARAANLQVMLDRGRCFAGHDFRAPGPVARHEHNNAECGYCLSARAAEAS